MHLCCERNSDKNLFFSFFKLPGSCYSPTQPLFTVLRQSRKSEERTLPKTFVITQRIVLTLFVRTRMFLTKFYGTSVAASLNSVMIS